MAEEIKQSAQFIKFSFLEDKPIWSAEWLSTVIDFMDTEHDAYLYSLYLNKEKERLELIFEQRDYNGTR